jgi:DNA-directed RNA polymerase III subunit RPC2
VTIGECPLDPGGYFIIRGNEKVIGMQENRVHNHIVLNKNNGSPNVSVLSINENCRSRTVLVYKKNCFYVRLDPFYEDLPLGVLFKAIGIESDQEIIYMVTENCTLASFLIPSFLEAKKMGINTTDEALLWMSEKKRSTYFSGSKNRLRGYRSMPKKILLNSILNLLIDNLLIHVPTNGRNFKEKAFYLVYMIQRILIVISDPAKTSNEIDNLDSLAQKRVKMVGDLFSVLFNDLFSKMCLDLERQLTFRSKVQDKQKFNLSRFIRPETLTSGIEYAINTGNLNNKGFQGESKGLVQNLNRMSFFSMLGNGTRINPGSLDTTKKLLGPRALQPSYWGFFCPNDTPEGNSCGIIKNSSLSSNITPDTDEKTLISYIMALGLKPFTETIQCRLSNNVNIVVLNGFIMGIRRFAMKFVQQLRAIRRTGFIGIFVSISLTSRLVNISR